MWVEDEGPGVAPEERELVFGKFHRGRSAASVPSGTGLGLAITREIVRFHGGRVWVEDVLPHGARFVVTIPTERPALSPAEGAAGEPADGRAREASQDTGRG
jgi:signal transduction histidine kinase